MYPSPAEYGVTSYSCVMLHLLILVVAGYDKYYFLLITTIPLT